MVRLPTVPAGENPYTVYRTAIQTLAYGRPTRGLAVRLRILTALTAFGLSSSFVLLGLVCLDQHRRRAKLWTFKVLQREDGRLIVTNLKFIAPLCGVAMSVVFLLYLIDAYNVHVNLGSQSQIGGWRTGIALPMVVSGWLLTFAQLQAYLLTPQAPHLSFLTPAVVNRAFAGFGSVLIVFLLALTILSSVVYSRTYRLYAAFTKQLVTLEATWSPGDDVVQALLPLQPSFDHLNASYITVQKCAGAFYVMTAVVVMVLFLINLGSLALLFTVRRQIFIKLGELGRHMWLSGDQDQLADESACAASPGMTSPTLSTDGVPSRSKIRRIARTEEFTPRGDSARQIMALQRAERDLLIIAWAVAQLAAGGIALCIFVAVLTLQQRFFTSSWPVLEFAYFSTCWALAIVSISFNIFSIHNTFVNLPPAQSPLAFNEHSSASVSRHGVPQPMSTMSLASRVAVTVERDIVVSLEPFETQDEEKEGLGKRKQFIDAPSFRGVLRYS